MKFRAKKMPKFWLVWLLLIVWSLTIGSSITFAVEPQNAPSYTIGQESYLKNCSSCHIPIAPEVLPTETWQNLIKKTQNHYGKALPPIDRVSIVLIWEYLRTFSRPLMTDEPIPNYIDQSRYFKALHPKVKFSGLVSHETCLSCHTGATKLNYRLLTPEWDNAP